MERKSLADMSCSIAQCLDIVGDSWTLLIVRDAFSGSTRFDQFQEWLGIPRNTLADRLAKLVAAGVMDKRPRPDHASRYDYELTDRGRALWPILAAMRQWGDHHGHESEPVVRMTHASCGGRVRSVTVCDGCGAEVGHEDVVLQPVGAER